MTTNARWLLLQLCDGTFPSGGFAHSSGLEACAQLGPLDGLGEFLDDTIRQAGRAALPFVRATCADPGRLELLDALYDAQTPMLVPNRASRAQGRALASAASRIWEELGAIVERARAGPCHHAPVLGAIAGSLGLQTTDAGAAFLHGAARTVLSAGVRLGLLGPLEAQRLLAARARLLDEVLAECIEYDPEDATQTAPLIELHAALHDSLDGRLFQS